ncbi:hypothetical protein [Antrihabitans cavernicola]|uniref:Uncharacterized protein n=1 Tax=Antrihabitans cavernicola TaxID=2495913 RepID=A0A5A7S6P5_9NOCA|nr:hypothetical protein [Spelaeibacter cavernicola]KAA0016570.1 hypothetical protein FOY51_26130 [Spelaeibacter cavernicola]
MTTLTLLRTGWGAVLLVAPRSVARGPVGSLDARDILVARILGARQLVQAAATGSGSSHRLRVASTGVDIVHAASMAGLALIDEPHRRPAIVDAVVASGFAAAGWVAATRSQRGHAETRTESTCLEDVR